MSSTLLCGDARLMLADLAPESVQCAVTSPPYFHQRDYGVAGQIGLEPTIAAYVAQLVAVFRAVRRVLAPTGVLWLNLGDSYSSDSKWGGASGCKNSSSAAGRMPRGQRDTGLGDKNLLLMPARVALALQADGWLLRADIIWHKPNVMPQGMIDRPTLDYEHLFLFAQQGRYYYDAAAIAEPSIQAGRVRPAERIPARVAQRRLVNQRTGDSVTKATRNKRSVWSINTAAFAGSHFATYPPALVTPCVLAGSRPGDTILDPFSGAGTTGIVAQRLGRHYIGIELNPAYAALAAARLRGDQGWWSAADALPPAPAADYGLLPLFAVGAL